MLIKLEQESKDVELSDIPDYQMTKVFAGNFLLLLPYLDFTSTCKSIPFSYLLHLLV